MLTSLCVLFGRCLPAQLRDILLAYFLAVHTVSVHTGLQIRVYHIYVSTYHRYRRGIQVIGDQSPTDLQASHLLPGGRHSAQILDSHGLYCRLRDTTNRRYLAGSNTPKRTG